MRNPISFNRGDSLARGQFHLKPLALPNFFARTRARLTVYNACGVQRAREESLDLRQFDSRERAGATREANFFIVRKKKEEEEDEGGEEEEEEEAENYWVRGWEQEKGKERDGW